MSLLNDILNKRIKTNQNENEQQTIQQVLNRQIDTRPTTLQGANAPRKANLSFVSKSEQNEAAKALLKSRQKYANYLQEQTKNTRSQKLPSFISPATDFSSRRNQLEELASNNARALRNASQTEEALQMKKDMREKQNTYNYANYMRNLQDVQDSNISGLEKAISPWTRGLDIVDPTRLTGTLTYYDSEGNRTYLPSKRELRQQKVREESKGAVGVYNDLVSSMSKAVTAKLIDIGTGGFGGQMLYYGNIMNESTDEALKQGYDNNEAITYGLVSTITAKTLDTVLNTFGGLSNLTGGKIPTLEAGVDKFIGNFVKNKFATVLLSNFTREGLSEFAEEFVDNYAKYIINSDKSDSDSLLDVFFDTLPSAGYAYLVGGLSGIVGGVAERNTIDTQERIKALTEYKNDLEKVQPNTPVEAEFKNDEINKVDNKIDEINTKTEEVNEFAELTNEDLQEMKNNFEQIGIDTNDIDNEINNREQQKTNQMNLTEKQTAQNKITQVQEAKIEKNASKKDTTSKVASKEEPPKAKVSKPLNFREALTNYEVEDILQQINTYNQEQIEKNLITTERVKESYNNNKINLAYATLVMKSNNTSDFSQTRAENYFKLLSKKLSDTDKNYIYRNLDKTNYKLAEMAEKYFAPTEKQDTTVQKIQQPNIIESKESKKQGQYQFDFDETNNYKTLAQENNYSKQETNAAERIQEDVLQISTSKEDTNQLRVMTSPPAKTQQTTTIKTDDGNVTKHYNLSQKTVTQGEDAIYDNINSRVTSKDLKQIEKQNTKVMEGILKAEAKARKEGKIALADAYKNKYDTYTYTVRSMGKNLSTQYDSLVNRLNTNSDIETEFKNLTTELDELHKSGKWDEINPESKNQDNALEWIEKANALMQVIGEDNTGTYDTIYNKLEDIKALDINHTAAQILAEQSVLARQNPDNGYNHAVRELAREYEKEKKYHIFDQKWQADNNPYDATNNSPYRFTEQERDMIKDKIAEIKKIDPKENDKEYQKAVNELNNMVAQAKVDRYSGIRGATKTLKNAIVTLIKQNNLLSVHVGTYNAASNVADTIGLNRPAHFFANQYQKKLAKSTGIVTNLYTKEGRSIYKKGLMQGLKEVGHDFKDGVTVSSRNTKYTIKGEIDFSKIGSLDYKVRAKTSIGQIISKGINEEGRYVTAWMSLGDNPKSTAVENEMLFEQLQQEAIRQSKNNGKNSIFYHLDNEKAGNITYYYTNEDGATLRRTIPISDSSSFIADNNMIEATDTMLQRAKEAGEQATYSQKANNKFAEVANNFRTLLNSAIPGWGDTTAQFTNVISNMAVETVRHSPGGIIELNKKTKALKSNQIYIEQQIEKAKLNGKDFTTTKKYADLKNQNYKLQSELGDLYGKVMSGTMAATLALTLKALGYATGQVSPEDKEKGIQDYSIKIGDKYYSYDFGVFGNVAKSGIVVEEALQKENPFEIATSLLKGYGDIILDNTIAKTFKETFMNTYGSEGSDVIMNWLTNNVSSLTTPGFVKEITLTLDDYTARSTYTNDKWQYLINRLNANWNREALPKKYDGWGNTIKKGSNLIESAWNTFFKTDFMSTVKDDKVNNELADVYQMTGEHNVLPLKENGTYKNSIKQFTYNKVQYSLTDKEKAKFSEVYGKSAYKNMEKLINSSIYQKADYPTKVKYIQEIYENARDDAKKDYLDSRGVDYYNEGQKVIIMGENDRFEQAKILDAIDNNISYQSASFKQNNPEKYKYATTIVGDYDIYSIAQTELEQIKELYPKANDRKRAYSEYINTFSKLSSIEKAMLIKTQYSSLYKSYDDKIKQYLKSKNLSDSEYQYALDQMGIK